MATDTSTSSPTPITRKPSLHFIPSDGSAPTVATVGLAGWRRVDRSRALAGHGPLGPWERPGEAAGNVTLRVGDQVWVCVWSNEKGSAVGGRRVIEGGQSCVVFSMKLRNTFLNYSK